MSVAAAAVPESRGRAPLRELVWTLVRTDFKARYHGTLGGFVWALLKPLAMFVALLAVFRFVFGAEPLYAEKLLVGLVLWDFFSEATKGGLAALHQKGFLVTKARFPTWVLVLSSVSNPLITLAVFALLVLVYLAASGLAPSAAGVAAFLLYLVALVGIVVGFGLGASVLFLRYRDLNQVWEVVCQAGFFVAPIIWPIGAVPEQFHLALYLWPPTPVIEFSRTALLEGALPSARANLLLAAEVAAVLGVGALVYRRLAPRAAEYL